MWFNWDIGTTDGSTGITTGTSTYGSPVTQVSDSVIYDSLGTVMGATWVTHIHRHLGFCLGPCEMTGAPSRHGRSFSVPNRSFWMHVDLTLTATEQNEAVISRASELASSTAFMAYH